MKQMNAARRQAHWDLRAAGNFMAGGTGCGLVLAAVVAALAGAGVPRLALLVAAACVGFGLLLVWLEIGKPWRALHVFFHPHTSWMTREGILAGPLLASCALGAWTGHALWLVPAAGFAGGFLYAQARILRAARAIPAWSHPRIVPLIVATGVAEGFGAYVALAAAFGGPESLPALVAALAIVAGVTREVVREVYRRALVAARAPQPTLEWFARPEVHVLRALRVLSVLLLALGLATEVRWVLAAGGVLAVLGGWGLKGVLVTRAAYTRGAMIPHAPTRGRSQARSVTN